MRRWYGYAMTYISSPPPLPVADQKDKRDRVRNRILVGTAFGVLVVIAIVLVSLLQGEMNKLAEQVIAADKATEQAEKATKAAETDAANAASAHEAELSEVAFDGAFSSCLWFYVGVGYSVGAETDAALEGALNVCNSELEDMGTADFVESYLHDIQDIPPTT